MLTKKRVIKVTLESVKGTYVAGTQAILAGDLKINIESEKIERPGSGKYLGGEHAKAKGLTYGVCTFTTELRGTGASGLEAGLAILLQACKLKKAGEVYNLHSNAADDKCISIDAWLDGEKRGLAGAAGKVKFIGESGKITMLEFEFHGIWQTPSGEAMPAHAPSSALPIPVKGATCTVDGEAMKWSKFELDLNNDIQPMLDANATDGVEYFEVRNWDPQLSIDPEATLTATYDFFGKQEAGTLVAVSFAFTDGTDTITFAMPKYQYEQIDEGDRSGQYVYNINGSCLNDSGDDAVTITAS